MQKVYVGRLLNGNYGLFTNGYLALPLTVQQVRENKAAAIAKRCGFELVANPRGETNAV